jgi:hypothetical protein
MKKLFLFVLLLGLYIPSWSQRYLEYKNTDIIITTDALDQIGAQVRWKVTIPVAMVDTAISLLPQIQGNFKYDAGHFYYSSVAPINAMFPIMDTAKCEQSDVGLTGNQLTSNFGLALLFMTNPLNLNQVFWAIKQD